jgi:hypothetical protein
MTFSKIQYIQVFEIFKQRLTIQVTNIIKPEKPHFAIYILLNTYPNSFRFISNNNVNSKMASSTRSRRAQEDSQGLVEERIVKTNGDVCVRRYNKGRFLGKGGFARVYEFTNIETRKIYAAKVVAKSSLTKSRAK